MSGGKISAWVELPEMGYSTEWVHVSADGRYEFGVPETTTRVYVNRDSRGHQPCPSTVTPHGSATLDVHIVSDPRQLNGNLPGVLASQQPTLSGVVFEQTTAGRRAVAGASVTLDAADGLGVLIASTLSDAAGRYLLCGVPQLPAIALVAGRPGYEVFYSSGDLTGRATLDIELRRTVN